MSLGKLCEAESPKSCSRSCCIISIFVNFKSMLTKKTFFMVLVLKMITITIRIVCFTTFNFFCLGTFSQENLCNPLFCPSAILFLFYRWRRFSFWKLQNNQVAKQRYGSGETMNCLLWLTWHNVMMWQWQDAWLICDIFQTFYIILMTRNIIATIMQNLNESNGSQAWDESLVFNNTVVFYTFYQHVRLLNDIQGNSLLPLSLLVTTCQVVILLLGRESFLK